MNKEEHLQTAVAQYLDYTRAVWCHVANERKTTPAKGAKLKRMGVKPGVPDILIFGPGPGNGLAIELKVKPNKTTAHQDKWLAELNKLGWKTAIAWDFLEAKNLIDNYLGL